MSRGQSISIGPKLALLVFTMLIMVGVLEAGVRVYKREIAFQPDPDVIRSLAPNKERAVYTRETEDNLNSRSNTIPDTPVLLGRCHTNNLGLRMKADIGPKKPGERRILVFGDSYTEALETLEENRFVSIAAQKIEEAGGAGSSTENRRWTLINVGIQSGAPSQYVLMLRRFLPMLEPDLVVVVTGANDLTDDSYFERIHGFVLDEDGAPLSLESRWRLWWLQKSYLLRYIEVGTRRLLPALYDLVFPPANPDVDVPRWMDILCDEDAASRSLYAERTGRYLRAMKQLAENAGVEFAVLVMHYLYTFDDEPYYEPRFPWLPGKLEEMNCYENNGAPFNDFIEAFLEQNQIHYRNTRDAMLAAKKQSPSRKLWNFYDYHFSPAGHEVVGQELYELITGMPQTGG